MWAHLRLAYQIYLLLKIILPLARQIIEEVDLFWTATKKDKVLEPAEENNAKLNLGVEKLKTRAPIPLSTPAAELGINAALIERKTLHDRLIKIQKGARR